MAVKTSSDFQAVQRIASTCQTIDPEWFETLDPDKQDQAIQECRQRLDKLAGLTIKCGALVLGQVRFRREVGDREQVRLTPFGLTANKAFSDTMKSHFKLNDDTIYPLSQKENDFYLLYNRKIIHVQMSSEKQTIIQLDPPNENFVWDISTSKIKEMVAKNWNDSFVTATYSWGEVIPIPLAKDQNSEECKE